MKKLFYLLFVLGLCIMAACEGPAGPEGPQGPQGEQGEKGATGARGPQGNANVKVADFSVSTTQWTTNHSSYFYRGEIDFAVNTEIFNEAIANPYNGEDPEGCVMVYTQLANLTYEALPYLVFNSNGEIVERTSFSWSAGRAGLLRLSYCAVRDNADGFDPPKRFRVVWIPSVAASEQATLMEMDYATVAATYGIEE